MNTEIRREVWLLYFILAYVVDSVYTEESSRYFHLTPDRVMYLRSSNVNWALMIADLGPMITMY